MMNSCKKHKKTLLIDLDGVLNEYNGNFNSEFIPQMRQGADKWLKNLAEKYELKLFTTRNSLLASNWLLENKISGYFSEVTQTKLPCYLFIDDRCVTFNGNFDDVQEK